MPWFALLTAEPDVIDLGTESHPSDEDSCVLSRP